MPASGRPAPPAPKRLSNTSVALRTTRPSASPSLPSCVVFRRRSCLEASADGLVVPLQADLFDQGLERYGPRRGPSSGPRRSEEHTSELQSQSNLVCRLLLEKKKKNPSLMQNPKKKKKLQRQVRKPIQT